MPITRKLVFIFSPRQMPPWHATPVHKQQWNIIITDHFYFLIDWWSFIQHYSPLSWADSLHSHVVLHQWLAFFSALFLLLNIHWCGVLTALAWLVPHETAAILAQVLCAPYNHAPCHFMQSHIRKEYACLAATCTFGRMTRIFYMLLQ